MAFNDNLPTVNHPIFGLVPVLGELGEDGVVTWFDPDAARAILARGRRPQLDLVADDGPSQP